MAGLGSELRDYLSTSNPNPNTGSVGGQSMKEGFFKYFGGQKDAESASGNIDETANGWFADAQKDPCLPSLTKKQRVIGFFGCILLGTFCFSLASLYLPFLVLKARKFALLYTLGSLFIIASFSLLWGPMNHVKHLLSMQRLPFTTCYFGTMFATLYFSIWLKSTIFTIFFAVCQILALVWYIVSYIPGGKTGLSFFSRVFYAAASKTVSKTLPV